MMVNDVTGGVRSLANIIALQTSCKSKCNHCGKDMAKFNRESNQIKCNGRLLPAENAFHMIQECITKNNVKCAFDISKLFLKNMFVPPTCIRPSVVMGNIRGESDLTHKLIEILKSPMKNE